MYRFLTIFLSFFMFNPATFANNWQLKVHCDFFEPTMSGAAIQIFTSPNQSLRMAEYRNTEGEIIANWLPISARHGYFDDITFYSGDDTYNNFNLLIELGDNDEIVFSYLLGPSYLLNQQEMSCEFAEQESQLQNLL